jgi:hypothetical protein
VRRAFAGLRALAARRSPALADQQREPSLDREDAPGDAAAATQTAWATAPRDVVVASVTAASDGPDRRGWGCVDP